MNWSKCHWLLISNHTFCNVQWSRGRSGTKWAEHQEPLLSTWWCWWCDRLTWWSMCTELLACLNSRLSFDLLARPHARSGTSVLCQLPDLVISYGSRTEATTFSWLSFWAKCIYCKISDIGCTKSQNLNDSRLVWQFNDTSTEWVPSLFCFSLFPFFLKLIVAYRLSVIYVREDNDFNV